jgi:hypothetical protein
VNRTDASAIFYATGIQRLKERWKKLVDNEEDFEEK